MSGRLAQSGQSGRATYDARCCECGHVHDMDAPCPNRGQLDSRNLLSDLPSLSRMSKRDQRRLDLRLRGLAAKAKEAGAITLAANLLRASYELDVLP